MSFKSLSLSTAAVFAASTLLLSACSSSPSESPQAGSTQDQELTPQERIEKEAGVSIEPGVASCDFNNELDEFQGDGSGVSEYPALDSAEIREEEDAYVVTFTGDFFSPDVLLVPDSKVSLQVLLSAEDFSAVSPTLMTDYRNGELELTGTFMDQEWHEQDTGATFEDGKFTATYSKDSPHFEDFELSMWAVSVYFDEGDGTKNPVSFRCGDGRSWDWEPLA